MKTNNEKETKMAKIRRSSLHKALSLLIIVVLAFSMITVLSSCGSKKLEKEDNLSIEAFAANILKSHEDSAIKFVAANRGNDITADDYKDTDKSSEKADVGAAKKVLKNAIEETKFKNDKDKTAALEFANKLDDEKIDKVVEALKVEVDLDQDAGFFKKLLIGIGKVLHWLTNLVGNSYVVAILIFAVFVEILMLPVAIKQQKNSIGMAKLRPQIMKIEKKYAGRTDQITLRKKQEEIMALQQKEGFSPFSGCLPLLIQLIIVGFILYPIIQNPLLYVLDQSQEFSSALTTYATAPKAAGGLGIELSGRGNVIELLSRLSIKDMEGIKNFELIKNGEECFEAYKGLDMPNFKLFGLEIGQVPKILSILVLVPILNVALQWVSMKLMRKWSMTGAPAANQDAQAQASLKIMDLVMPLMTLVIMFQVPALIGIYWLFRSGLSLLKSFIMKKVMPIPQYTEAELKEMEKAQKAAEKARKEALKEQPKYRSLHYIDEDDYDELPTLKNENEKKSKGINGDLPNIKD